MNKVNFLRIYITCIILIDSANFATSIAAFVLSAGSTRRKKIKISVSKTNYFNVILSLGTCALLTLTFQETIGKEMNTNNLLNNNTTDETKHSADEASDIKILPLDEASIIWDASYKTGAYHQVWFSRQYYEFVNNRLQIAIAGTKGSFRLIKKKC